MNIQLLVPLRNTEIEEVLFKDKSKNFKFAVLQFCYKPTEIIYLYIYIVSPCSAMHTDSYPISIRTINNITHVPFSVVLRLKLSLGSDWPTSLLNKHGPRRIRAAWIVWGLAKCHHREEPR